MLTKVKKSDKIRNMMEETIMKRILWVSRHAMTKEQFDDLERIYGEVEIIQYDKTVENVKDILRNDVDVYAVVLPINLISDLRKNTTAEIIQSVSGRVSTGKTVISKASGKYESEYVFQHLYWQKIKNFDIETERL